MQSQAKPCPAPCAGVAGALGKAVAGSALLVIRLHSGGLKQFRGSWLCSDPGLITWRPPVYTGPRE